MLSRKRDELLLILNFSSPSLRLHGWICLRVSQTSKHSKVVTFSFSNELRGLGVRIRMELLSATQEQAGNSLDAKQIRVFRAGCPWYPLAKLVFRRSTIINFPKGQKNSYIVTSLLLWTLQDASFALLKFCRSCQTNNTICLPQSVLILKSQKQYCIKWNWASQLFPEEQKIHVHVPPNYQHQAQGTLEIRVPSCKAEAVWLCDMKYKPPNTCTEYHSIQTNLQKFENNDT